MKKVLLVSVNIKPSKTEYEIEETKKIIEAIGYSCVAEISQNRSAYDTKTLIGSGKIAEINSVCDMLSVDIIVFHNELSGSQLKNLNALINTPIIDRNILILDIFAQRCRTKLSKMQIELAQLKYLKSRLVGMRTYLSRQGGGIGTRGPGETQLETDRRKIDIRINRLSSGIDKQLNNMDVQRKRRKKSVLPTVGIVGYTNSGKSSLINYFINKYENPDNIVFEKNILFASLSTYIRSIHIDSNFSFFLLDTVGFISNLSGPILSAFKSTLDEINICDLLIHVIDASDENYENKEKSVNKILQKYSIDTDRIIKVYSKADLLESRDKRLLISSKTGEGIDSLIQTIRNKLYSDEMLRSFYFENTQKELKDYSKFSLESKIVNTEYKDNGFVVEAIVNKSTESKYKEYLI